MSRKRILERERTAAVEFLERCGWTNAELIWEQIQEAAAQAWLDGDPEEARRLWQGALEVADEHLEGDDPRCVTSRINAGAPGGGTGEAPGAWKRCSAWVAGLKPSVPARSSMFHLRLRAKHPGAYDRQRQETLRALHEQGLERLRGEDPGEGFPRRVARWHAEKPAGFNDYRKLLAAVLLMRDPE